MEYAQVVDSGLGMLLAEIPQQGTGCQTWRSSGNLFECLPRRGREYLHETRMGETAYFHPGIFLRHADPPSPDVGL